MICSMNNAAGLGQVQRARAAFQHRHVEFPLQQRDLPADR
jgi:hypothetical protein